MDSLKQGYTDHFSEAQELLKPIMLFSKFLEGRKARHIGGERIRMCCAVLRARSKSENEACEKSESLAVRQKKEMAGGVTMPASCLGFLSVSHSLVPVNSV